MTRESLAPLTDPPACAITRLSLDVAPRYRAARSVIRPDDGCAVEPNATPGGGKPQARMADGVLTPDPADTPVEALLATKLFVPRPAAYLVRRPRLRETLRRGLQGPLTLLAAPAGWGKTTLLGEWRADAPDAALAWVSLDPRDNDPARFWTYVIAALQAVQPTVGAAARVALRSPRAPPLDAILTTVLNELTTVSIDTVLVLDDYHAIESATIHESLTFLLDRLPPSLHVVLATRADPPLPLARWRARGAMVEIRANDLRFTVEEAGAFLGQVHGLPLEAATIVALESRTEGWIAGLQLAALAMRDRRDPTDFVGAFTGSHRFVADYLAEEVFQRQTPAVQDFLLHTAILDRMCASLCQALADDVRDPRDAQRLLEQLDRANLFLIPLDGERRWYRYHHLFADLLRARLQQEQPDQVQVLHRRASVWFERAGLVGEAIQHALRAGEFPRAADLLEPVADPLLMGGEMATLNGWLAQLSAPVLRVHPRLLIARAGALHLLESRPLEAIEPALRVAAAALGETDPPRSDATDTAAAAELDRLAGRLVAIHAWEAGWPNGTGPTMTLAREALDRLGPDDGLWRALALTPLGIGHSLRGEVVAATDALAEAARLALAAGASYVAQGALLWLASTHVVRGRLREASALYQQGLDEAYRQGGENLPSNAGPLIRLGCSVDYEWNDLETAERHLEEGIRLAGPQLFPWMLIDACATLARIKLMQGERGKAAELLRRMDQHTQTVVIPWAWMVPRVAASVARAYLAVGQVDRADEWGAQLDVSGADDLAAIAEFQRTTATRLLIARGQAARALAMLDEMIPPAEANGRWGPVIEMETLRAVALEGMGKREDALAALGRALTLAQPEGYVRRFVDEGPTMQALLTETLRRGIAPGYAGRLLRGFETSPSLLTGVPAPGAPPRTDGTQDPAIEPKPELDTAPASPSPLAGGEVGDGGRPSPPPVTRDPLPLVEPLSERERDVLRLLIAGRSAPEIAEALIVAPSTVRTHLKSIYGKLDAHTRVQAIARARELKLV
jgi:LuxR family maltose regulon positive regulatory protein